MSDSPVVTQALVYAARGLAVIPVNADKLPLWKKDWPNRATTKPAYIRMIWAKVPNAGIGIVTGSRSGGLVVIDLDVKHPPINGIANWELFLKDQGINLPETLRVKTPSGGEHRYYRAPEGFEFGDRIGMLEGVDVKAGGFVGAPLTEGYEFSNEFDGVLPILPIGLITEKPARSANTEPRIKHTSRNLSVYVDALLSLQRADAGKAHDALVDATFIAAEFVADGLIEKDTAESDLNFAAMDRNIPSGEFNATVNGIFSEIQQDPETNSLLSGPWGRETLWAADLIWSDDNVREPIWGPPESPLWKGEQSLLIAGESGLGKSTLALSLVAARIGLLPDVIGWPVRDDGGRVLYLALDRPAQTREMLWRLVPRDDMHKRQILNERVILKEGPLPVNILKEKDWLPEQARAVGAKLIVIDCLEDVILNPSDAVLAGAYNWIRQTLVTAGIDLIEVHHTRKQDLSGHGGEGNANDVFGAIVIRNGAGSILTLSKSKDADDDSTEVYLRQVKSLTGTLPRMTLTRDEKAGVFNRSAAETLEDRIILLFAKFNADGTPVRLKTSEVYSGIYPEGSNTAQEGNIRSRLSRLVKIGWLVKNGAYYVSC